MPFARQNLFLTLKQLFPSQMQENEEKRKESLPKIRKNIQKHALKEGYTSV